MTIAAYKRKTWTIYEDRMIQNTTIYGANRQLAERFNCTDKQIAARRKALIKMKDKDKEPTVKSDASIMIVPDDFYKDNGRPVYFEENLNKLMRSRRV